MGALEYNPSQVGTVLTVIGLISALAQGVLIGPMTKRWGEVAVIRGSLLFSAVGFVIMLQAQAFAAVLLTTGFFIISNSMLRRANPIPHISHEMVPPLPAGPWLGLWLLSGTGSCTWATGLMIDLRGQL